MRSSSSKTTTPSSSSRRGSRARRLFQSACLCSTRGGSDDTDSEYQKKITLKSPCAVQTRTQTDDIKIECCKDTNVEKSDELPCLSPSLQLDQWDQGSISDGHSRSNGQSVQVSSGRPTNYSNTFLSRFNLIPRSIGFRISRITCLRSSRRSFPVSSPQIRVLSDENEGRDRINGSQVELDTHTISPAQLVVGDINSPGLVVDVDSNPPRTQSQMESIETRHLGWTAAREHNERNLCFSRTLSVGRLRDRVLRHSSLSDHAFSPLQQETEVRTSEQDSERNTGHGDTVAPASEVNHVCSFSPGHASSSLPSSLRSTGSRYNELLENQSNFLESRRRIRSQVHALRRLGSRFENLSGHARSCIISGQHRTGRCTCHRRSHDTGINNDSNTRSSISRIVMLAEALFEVLDEIHQQSVVSSSGPSISSIGSVPATNEVVESLPLKFYSKAKKYQTEDTDQCYICLLDYEEHDSLRILPCQHEFHRACVDKWLKEIHRVCPLCRGDVCRSNSLPLEM